MKYDRYCIREIKIGGGQYSFNWCHSSKERIPVTMRVGKVDSHWRMYGKDIFFILVSPNMRTNLSSISPLLLILFLYPCSIPPPNHYSSLFIGKINRNRIISSNLTTHQQSPPPHLHLMKIHMLDILLSWQTHDVTPCHS